MNTSMNNTENETVANKASDRLLMPVLVALFIIILVALQWGQSSRTPGIALGELAPEFQVKTLDGKVVKLSDYRGKIVFLNFWATFCSSCLSEMPSMNSLFQKLDEEHFAMLAINVDNDEEKAKKIAQSGGWKFTVGQDTGGAVAGMYRTTGIPETFILDRQGRVVEYVIGPMNWDSPEALKSLTILSQQGEENR
jgi:cytochrome c biogenesis protein CcmG, thiol:disulfide interchange protein DsbE